MKISIRQSEKLVTRFVVAAITALALASSSGSALAGPAAKVALAKPTKKRAAMKKPAMPAPIAPIDHSAGALSSCKQHVENMLKSPATRFEGGRSINVVKADGESFDVSGPVRSANKSGEAIGGNFNCRAQRIGGAVWSTRTSLDFAR